MSRLGEVGHRLYTGDISYDFIGRRRRWYALSGVVLVISLVSLLVRGINPSIEFTGGSQFTLPSNGHSVADARAVLDGLGLGGDKSVVQTARQTSGSTLVEVSTGTLEPKQSRELQRALATKMGDQFNDVQVETIGSSWGSDITKKALEGLIAFLIAVVIYLSMRYEPKMAVAAIIALVHDLIITAGIYSLVGFEVSPSTVIALLTILGYSLYDTVVVFDKVRENTQGLGQHSRVTFSQATNLAVNQTLVRSINTSIIALLPVAGLLFIGAGLLGAGTLKDLSLALFIGLASGAYSSIFIASPLLCELKEREPAMRELSRRVANREAAEARVAATGRAPAGATALGAGGGAAAMDEATEAEGSGPAGEPAGVPSGPAGPGAVVSGGQSGATMRNPRRAQGRPGAKRRR
ncbi:MAG: protein translocase subunit SecF [Frankiaceae bacterium]